MRLFSKVHCFVKHLHFDVATFNSRILNHLNKIWPFREVGMGSVWRTEIIPLLKQKLSVEDRGFYPSHTVRFLIACVSCQRVGAIERSDPESGLKYPCQEALCMYEGKEWIWSRLLHSFHLASGALDFLHCLQFSWGCLRWGITEEIVFWNSLPLHLEPLLWQPHCL